MAFLSVFHGLETTVSLHPAVMDANVASYITCRYISGLHWYRNIFLTETQGVNNLPTVVTQQCPTRRRTHNLSIRHPIVPPCLALIFSRLCSHGWPLYEVFVSIQFCCQLLAVVFLDSCPSRLPRCLTTLFLVSLSIPTAICQCDRPEMLRVIYCYRKRALTVFMAVTASRYRKGI